MSEHFIHVHEDDGTLCRLQCLCGWKSGLVDHPESVRLVDEHYAAGKPIRTNARRFLLGPNYYGVMALIFALGDAFCAMQCLRYPSAMAMVSVTTGAFAVGVTFALWVRGLQARTKNPGRAGSESRCDRGSGEGVPSPGEASTGGKS